MGSEEKTRTQLAIMGKIGEKIEEQAVCTISLLVALSYSSSPDTRQKTEMENNFPIILIFEF